MRQELEPVPSTSTSTSSFFTSLRNLARSVVESINSNSGNTATTTTTGGTTTVTGARLPNPNLMIMPPILPPPKGLIDSPACECDVTLDSREPL